MIKKGRSVISRKINTYGELFPAGCVFSAGTTLAPDGWLTCDGSAVSRITYSDLFRVIGEKYGSGDGSTTFNLPDLRGRFLRGADLGAGRDVDAGSRTAQCPGGNIGNNIGSAQASLSKTHDHTLNHSHTCTPPSDVHCHQTVVCCNYFCATRPELTASNSLIRLFNQTDDLWVSCYHDYKLGADTNGTILAGRTSTDAHSQTVAIPNYVGNSCNNTGSTESRPVNIYLNFIIKI